MEKIINSRPDASIAFHPEPTTFATLPAYGFYCHHVKGLSLTNIRLRTTAKPNLRHSLVHVVFDGLRSPHRIKVNGDDARGDIQFMSGLTIIDLLPVGVSHGVPSLLAAEMPDIAVHLRRPVVPKPLTTAIELWWQQVQGRTG